MKIYLDVCCLNRPFDASAENSPAEIFLTTDYDILKKYRKHPDLFFVPIKNPLTLIMEMNR